jgi:hypothetical protein
MNAPAREADDREQQIVESTPTMAMLNKSEIDQQVTTAHAYPRSVKAFLQEAETLATLSEEVAESCSYALPRREKDKETNQWITKTIEGPSARFAEIIFSCWGNARAGTRIVDEGQEFITAQGFMFDLQKNVAIQVDVPRRIVSSSGQRYKTDMIGVTANAAASIALRNAILKVIPKALWDPIYQKAKATAIGTEATLSNKRSDALKAFQKRGASAETIFEHLAVKGIEDITLEHLATLKGYLTAIKEGDTTVEQIFSKDDPAASGKGNVTTLKDIAAKSAKKPTKPASEEPSGPTYAQLAERMQSATDVDIAALILDEGRALSLDEQNDLAKLFAEKFPAPNRAQRGAARTIKCAAPHPLSRSFHEENRNPHRPGVRARRNRRTRACGQAPQAGQQERREDRQGQEGHLSATSQR